MTGPELGAVLLCSVRYALGRNTYVPAEIRAIVYRARFDVPETHRKLMAKEIREAATEWDRAAVTSGRSLPESRQWMKLADEIHPPPREGETLLERVERESEEQATGTTT